MLIGASSAFIPRIREATTMTIAWICIGLIAGTPTTDPVPAPDVASTYREAREKAGRSPEDQVRLALWCEANGLPAERLHHLTLAVLADPGHATARGLMGMVWRDGRWRRPEAVAEGAKADPALAEYESRRQKAAYTADAQWSLGLWAEEHGLAEQARAHLRAVTRLDPSREAAWKKLGYRKFEGRWRTDAGMAAEKAELEAQERADRAWPPLLARWRGWLDVAEKRAEAEAALGGLSDPRAVGAVVKVFGAGGPAQQALAVRLLGQVDSPGSSRALALLATWGKTPDVRRSAAEVLKHRDPREFVGLLIARLRKPIRYEMGLLADEAGKPHLSLTVEGEKANVQVNSNWVHESPQGSLFPRMFADSMPFDPYGSQAAQVYGNPYGPSADSASIQALAGLAKGHGALARPPGVDPANALVYQATYAASLRDAQIARAQAQPPRIGPNFQAQTSAMMAEVDAYNASVAEEVPLLYASLGLITGRDLPPDPEPWKTWWFDSLGYSYKSTQSTQATAPKPTYEYTIVSCFAAGTPVRTLTGDRPIEALRVGDQVLSQDTASGELRYRMIAGVHHNPPALALRVKLGGDVILATGFHRFWVGGRGWVMARELKAGDPVRTLEGIVRVDSIEPDRVQPVFNLDVADDADFFVGRLGALVHDNTLPNPRLAPFDASPKLGARKGD